MRNMKRTLVNVAMLLACLGFIIFMIVHALAHEPEEPDMNMPIMSSNATGTANLVVQTDQRLAPGAATNGSYQDSSSMRRVCDLA